MRLKHLALLIVPIVLGSLTVPISTAVPQPAPSPTDPEPGGASFYSTTTSLYLKKHLVAKGRVTASDARCYWKTPVLVQRETPAGWKTIVTATTTTEGTYRVKIKDKPGRYRSFSDESTPGNDMCNPSKSGVARHRH